MDTDKRILWANPGAGWILAALQSEIVGNPVTQFFTPEDQATGIPDHEQRSALRQGSSDDDRWMLRADGSRFWASGKTIALSRHDGTPMGFMKIFRDQTEFKMRLEARGAGPDAASANASLTAVARDAGVRFLLQEELQEAIAVATRRIDPAGRDIQLLLPAGAPIEIEGDRDRIREAFAVLVENAMRATSDDGRIWINGTTEDQRAVVRVEDNGRGLVPDVIAALYALFTRPAALSADAEGGGFARVHSIVDQHGGTVQVLSEGAGKGSAFVVRLPLHRAWPAAGPSP